MKNVIKICTLIFTGVILFAACKKETTPKALEIQVPDKFSNDYYANLRAFKKTKHQISFAWGDSEPDPNDPTVGFRFSGMPDSLDIYSLFTTIPKDSGNLADLRYTQQVKGTRFVFCQIISRIVNNFPQNDDGIRQAAQSVVDSVYKYGLDGFDIDYEPHYGDNSILNNPKAMAVFVTALSQFFGPKSGTGKLLIVDGEPNFLLPELGELIDYGIAQSYSSYGYKDLQNRYNATSGIIPPGKFIVTENFQTNAANGGGPFLDTAGNTVPSFLGMAAWQPTQGEKGGAGVYIIEGDYNANSQYNYFREGIQIMNPAKP